MIRFNLRKGLRFLEPTQGWTLERKTILGKLQFLSDEGEVLNLNTSELNQRWLQGKWVVDPECLAKHADIIHLSSPRSFDSFSEDKRKNATRKSDYITGVISALRDAGERVVFTKDKLNPVLKAVAEKLKDPNPPSPSTFYTWWQKFMPTKCITALVDARRRNPLDRDPEVTALFEETLHTVYLTVQKRPKKAVVEALSEKIRSINRGLEPKDALTAPSAATVYRWLSVLQADLEMAARLGKKAADKLLRSVLSGVKVDHILERVEVDHTPVDVLVVDTLTRMVLGRPWLSIALDCKSKSILGFYLSFHAPSAYSVLNLLKCAVLPKEEILANFPGVRQAWPCCGIMDLVVSDNGMDLHATGVEVTCYDLGIDIQYCGAGCPELKGAIERVIGTAQRQLIHQLPGTTFSCPEQRGDYPSELTACIDIRELTSIMLKWIVDVYQHTPHKALGGMTPHQAWMEGLERRSIELPISREAFETIIGFTCTRTLFHYGVEVDNLRYNSPELQLIRCRTNAKARLRIKFYEDDVSYISVLDPSTEEYIKVPAIRQDYAKGMTRYAHRLICEDVRRRFGENAKSEDFLLAKADMAALFTKLGVNIQSKSFKQIAANNLQDSEGILRPRPAASTSPHKVKDVRPRPPAPLDAGLDDELPDVAVVHRVATEAI